MITDSKCLHRAMMACCPAESEAITLDQWMQLTGEILTEIVDRTAFQQVCRHLIERHVVGKVDNRYFDCQKTTHFQLN